MKAMIEEGEERGERGERERERERESLVARARAGIWRGRL